MIVANLDDTEEVDMKGKYSKSRIIERDGRKIGLIGALVSSRIFLQTIFFLNKSQPGRRNGGNFKPWKASHFR